MGLSLEEVSLRPGIFKAQPPGERDPAAGNFFVYDSEIQYFERLFNH